MTGHWLSDLVVIAVVGGLIGGGIGIVLSPLMVRVLEWWQGRGAEATHRDLVRVEVLGGDLSPCCRRAFEQLLEQDADAFVALMESGDTDTAADLVAWHIADTHGIDRDSDRFLQMRDQQRRLLASSAAVMEAERIVRGVDAR